MEAGGIKSKAQHSLSVLDVYPNKVLLWLMVDIYTISLPFNMTVPNNCSQNVKVVELQGCVVCK